MTLPLLAETVNCTRALPASGSVSVNEPSAFRPLSSASVTGPGTVRTGGKFTVVTVMLAVLSGLTAPAASTAW